MKKFHFTLLLFSGFLLLLTADAIAQAPSDSPADEQVSFVAVGDNLLHNTVIYDMKTPGAYDFLPIYGQIRDRITAADIAFVNEEGVFAGDAYGYKGYPLLNAPTEAGKCLAEIGFDIIGEANNHALDFGEEGIRNTIGFWKSALCNVLLTGIYNSEKERSETQIIQKNGIKIAVLSYTDSTNGNRLPEGKRYLLSTTDAVQMEEDLRKAKTAADTVVVFIHWGEEYETIPSDRQRDLARFLSEQGADLIVGCHPHVLQPAEWILNSRGDRTLVVYSLGNFISSQHKRETMLGGLLSLSFQRGKDGRVVITNPQITPVVTHFEFKQKGFRIYPLSDYTDNLAIEHGITEFDKPVSLRYFEELAKSILGGFYREE